MNNKNYETATLAGGCFWCIEAAFQEIEGVIDVITGYTGGEKDNPSYEEVCSGKTGHFEAVQITFDPEKISFSEILDRFWKQIDPTDDTGQFVDKGPQYRTAIFYHNQEQKQIAEKAIEDLENSGKLDSPVVTQILPLEKFYKAEEHHQDYFIKSSLQYKLYKNGSGRKETLGKLWKEEH